MSKLTYDAPFFEVTSRGELEIGSLFSAQLDGKKQLGISFGQDERRKILFLSTSRIVPVAAARLPALVIRYVGSLTVSPEPDSHSETAPRGLGLFIEPSGKLWIVHDGSDRTYIDPSDGYATTGVTAGGGGLYFSDWAISQWRDGTQVVLFATCAGAAPANP
jgi:hypothetical protein